MDPRLKWAFQQSVRQLVRLGAKFNKWRADATVKIPELMQSFSKLTKMKWDDKVIDVATAVVRIWKPFFNWISKNDQKIIDNMEAKIREANKSLPKVKEEGKSYITRKRNAIESVQAQRNINTEHDIESEELDMSKKKKRGNLPHLGPNQKGQLPDDMVKKNPKNRGKNANMYNIAKTILDPMSNVPITPNYWIKKIMTKKIKGENDLSWYNNYPELIKGLITPNFMRRKGILESAFPAVAVPSVCGVRLEECLGSDINGAYTSSTIKMFTSLRMANTGSTVYTKIDVEKYLLNVRAAIIAIRQLRRMYALATIFSALDNDIPEAFFTAMGFSYSAIKDNLANLRQYINYASEKLHVITPIKIDLLERTCWLCDNVFKDSDDAKAQYYVTYFDKVWYCDPNGTNNPVQLTLMAGSFTYAQLIAQVDTLVSALVNSPVNGLIAADILKAYGQESMAYFMVIPEDYDIDFVYSEEVLTQIQNATVLPVTHTMQPNVAGDTLTEVVSHTFTENPTPGSQLAIVYDRFCRNKIINFYKDNIDPLDVVGATRFSVLGSLDSSGNPDKMEISAYGTEIVTLLNFVTRTPGGISGYTYSNASYDGVSGFVTVNGIRDFIILHNMWVSFDWAPSLRYLSLFSYDSSGTLITYASDIETIDYNNYAKLTSTEQLQDIHNLAVLSLYYVSNKIRETKVTDLKPLE